jgi:hypothetical protein
MCKKRKGKHKQMLKLTNTESLANKRPYVLKAQTKVPTHARTGYKHTIYLDFFLGTNVLDGPMQELAVNMPSYAIHIVLICFFTTYYD